MKTLLVGAGALSGIIGARLLAAGASVSLATRNAKSAEEIKASGLRVTGIGGDCLSRPERSLHWLIIHCWPLLCK
jgi:ketopantoate reductase